MSCCQTPGPRLKPATDFDLPRPWKTRMGPGINCLGTENPGLHHPC